MFPESKDSYGEPHASHFGSCSPAARYTDLVDYDAKMKAAVLFLALALAVCVHADMYLHNPRYRKKFLQFCHFIALATLSCVSLSRGSNNRLDEAKRDRNNANR